MENQLHEDMQRIFSLSANQLGQPTLRTLLAGLDLKKIVRESSMPHSNAWPQQSWEDISRFLASSELCLIGVLHHLSTGIGRPDNVRALANWSFKYAEYAYWETGYNGRDATKLSREE